MLISKIIFEYLKTNRRITVPALGTFLSKGDDDVLLFSEFMKNDDGVLRETVVASGLSELEAAIVIDRFVFDLRHKITLGEAVELPYLGYMRSADCKNLLFDYDPAVRERSAVEPQVAEVAEASLESAGGVVSGEVSEPAQVEVAEIYQSEPQGVVEEPVAAPQNLTKPKRKGLDIWMCLGIIVMLFAIVALCYGLLSEWRVGSISFGETIDEFLYNYLGDYL